MLRTIVRRALAAALAAFAVAPAAAEEVAHIAGGPGEPALLVRREPGPGPAILFVHGATFPSALSVAYRIDGRSWMDDLRARGFDVWAFDFAGYGGSDRLTPSAGDTPPGRTPDAARQIERVARHAIEVSGRRRISVIAHSWGTLPAGLFASRRPELMERLVLFGPVARREGGAGDLPQAALYPVTADDQWRSFQAGLPAGQASLIDPAIFRDWAAAYLATDPGSATRSPASVLVPTGPQADFAEAWSGRFPYDPATVRAPTLIVRGEWDNITRDADAAWLVGAFTGAAGGARDVKLPRGGHRMHLEENRQALFDAVGAFLAEDAPRRP